MPRHASPVRPLRLDRFLPYRLSLLTARVTQRLAREYEAAVGLQLPEARVMTVLGFFRPISSNAVVRHTSMDKATVSRAVARLIRLGMLTRKPDPRDNRLLMLEFTPRGRRAYARLTRIARAWQAWFTAGLAPREIARLEDMLGRLAARLDRVPEPQFAARKAGGSAADAPRKAASRPSSSA